MAPTGRPGPSTTGSSRSRAPPSTRRRTSQAAQHLQQWIKAGYFDKDANATDYADDDEPVQHGEGLLIFDGDWESGNLDKQMPGNVGFFLMPPAQPGGKHAAMSAPLTFGIAAKAKHADCAAFFLNWVATNPAARKIDVNVGGSQPGGPADAYRCRR